MVVLSHDGGGPGRVLFSFTLVKVSASVDRAAAGIGAPLGSFDSPESDGSGRWIVARPQQNKEIGIPAETGQEWSTGRFGPHRVHRTPRVHRVKQVQRRR
jgi:hypothetical protein